MGDILIQAMVYDSFGDPASGVFAWPENRPQDQTYIIGNGELIMTGLNLDDIIVFSYFDKTIAKIPVSEIGEVIEVNKAVELNEVELSNSNWLLRAMGFVGILSVGYVLLSDDTQKVDL